MRYALALCVPIAGDRDVTVNTHGNIEATHESLIPTLFDYDLSIATPLLPSDVAMPELFDGWKHNRTMTLNKFELAYSEGEVVWQPPIEVVSKLALLPGVVSPSVVATILAEIDGVSLDTEADTVDGMPSHEIMLSHSGRDGAKGKQHHPLAEDHRADVRAARAPVRAKLEAVMQPIIDDQITPFVHRRFASQCSNADGKNKCQVCTSLVRRYRPALDRSTHNVHRDGEALVSVVVSLSDYGADYRGGLYVSNGHKRHLLPLMRGDAVVHQSDLLHGVQVVPDASPSGNHRKNERFSWILWYKDDVGCVHRSYEWSRACAEAGGNPVCEYQQGSRAAYNPANADEAATQREAFDWYLLAAHGALPEAMTSVARTYMVRGEMQQGMHWLLKARTAGEGDACYILAWMRANEATAPKSRAAFEAVKLLEEAAAFGATPLGGATKAMYNLGVAHLYGYGVGLRDPRVAMQWFEASMLPEGYFAASLAYESWGMAKKAKRMHAHAKRMGFDTSQRKMNQDNVLKLHIWPTTGSQSGPPKL